MTWASNWRSLSQPRAGPDVADAVLGEHPDGAVLVVQRAADRVVDLVIAQISQRKHGPLGAFRDADVRLGVEASLECSCGTPCGQKPRNPAYQGTLDNRTHNVGIRGVSSLTQPQLLSRENGDRRLLCAAPGGASWEKGACHVLPVRRFSLPSPDSNRGPAANQQKKRRGRQLFGFAIWPPCWTIGPG